MFELILAAAAVTVPTQPATGDAGRAAVTAYIRHCEAVWARAGTADHAADLASFIADDFEAVSPDGRVYRKLAALARTTPPDRAAGLYYAKVRFVTPVLAIARGEEWNQSADGGRHHLIWTDSWAYRAGRWRIVAAQDNPVPVDRKPQG